MATKKGRPTDNPKNDMIRVRIDKTTLEQLDYCVEEQKSNRSAVIRDGIKSQYEKIKK